MFRSLRWRLSMSYTGIALITALAIGAILITTLRGYYARREQDYLMTNAATIGRSVADLLAIGVVPEHQRRGIGTRLLAHVIGVVSAVAPSHGIPDLRLTVAHTKVVWQRWYARSGFRVVDGEHGTYANGQRAIRMYRKL